MNTMVSPEARDSYLSSLSNLAVLSLFHQYGVNVSNYPDYKVIVEYSQDEGPDIVLRGFTRLFQKTCHVTMYEDEMTESQKEVVNEIRNKGLEEQTHEMYFFIPLSKFNSVLEIPESLLRIEKVIEENKNEEYHFEIILSSSSKSLVVGLDYEGDFHYLVNNVLKIYDELESFIIKV